MSLEAATCRVDERRLTMLMGIGPNDVWSVVAQLLTVVHTASGHSAYVLQRYAPLQIQAVDAGEVCTTIIGAFVGTSSAASGCWHCRKVSAPTLLLIDVPYLALGFQVNRGIVEVIVCATVAAITVVIPDNRLGGVN